MAKIDITYYRLPIASIPFSEIKSLEKFKAKFIFCSAFPLIEFMGLDFDMVTVYNSFDDESNDIAKLKSNEPLFGKVVSDSLPTRGKVKCLKVGTEGENITNQDLPHLKYNSSDTFQLDGNWFYMKDGKYTILSGIKSELNKVRHLEGISIYGDNIIRLRIVIELLKLNVKKGIVKLNDQEYKRIAYKVLRTDPTLLSADESLIIDGVNNWVPTMLLIPLSEDIPKEIRGRVIA